MIPSVSLSVLPSTCFSLVKSCISSNPFSILQIHTLLPLAVSLRNVITSPPICAFFLTSSLPLLSRVPWFSRSFLYTALLHFLPFTLLKSMFPLIFVLSLFLSFPTSANSLSSFDPFVHRTLSFTLGLCSTRFVRLHNHAWLRRYVPLGVTGYSSRFEFSTLYNRGTFYVGISNLSATQTNANRAWSALNKALHAARNSQFSFRRYVSHTPLNETFACTVRNSRLRSHSTRIFVPRYR